jgi:hypothetical protein
MRCLSVVLRQHEGLYFISSFHHHELRRSRFNCLSLNPVRAVGLHFMYIFPVSLLPSGFYSSDCFGIPSVFIQCVLYPFLSAVFSFTDNI